MHSGEMIANNRPLAADHGAAASGSARERRPVTSFPLPRLARSGAARKRRKAERWKGEDQGGGRSLGSGLEAYLAGYEADLISVSHYFITDRS